MLTLGLYRCECMCSFTLGATTFSAKWVTGLGCCSRSRINFHADHSAVLKRIQFYYSWEWWSKTCETCLSFTLHIHWGHISLRSLYLFSQITVWNFMMNEINSSFHWFVCSSRHLSLLDALVGQRREAADTWLNTNYGYKKNCNKQSLGKK